MGDLKEYFTICILPWLHFDEVYELNEVCLVPFQLNGNQDANLGEMKPALKKILASYVDITGRPIDQCTLLTIKNNGPEWNINGSDRERIMESLACFFLVAFSCNDYFSQASTYVNASVFQPFFQEFEIPLKEVRFRRRRRDGWFRLGGYDHGEAKISIPLECISLKAEMDPQFLNALGKAIKDKTPFVRRLLTSLSFLRLANTDQSHMSLDAEVILTIAAFEQLFDAHEKYKLTTKYRDCFDAFKTKIVKEVLSARDGIKLDENENKGKDTEWQLGRKWVQELYDLRSTNVHGVDKNKRSWGWSPFEHLVMSAFIYPLAVKLLLQEEGHYILVDKDKIACMAIDIILSKTNWFEPPSKNENQTQWQKCISEAWWKCLRSEPLETFVERGDVPS